MIKLIYVDCEENFKELASLDKDGRLVRLLECFSIPITVAVESNYSDPDYKDMYYNFYASKYQEYEKYCHRIVVFSGRLTEQELFDANSTIEEKLIGAITIRPLKQGSIGRTYIDPKYLISSRLFVRTTMFTIGFAGRKLSIDAFPFSSQDGEYMSCAETVLWMILHYYGDRYKEYKSALPHEILKIVDESYYQRVLPSVGLHVTHSSTVLKKFGFSSKVYYRILENKTQKSELLFRRAFHYYVESGVPLMVGVRLESKTTTQGHAIACIGHGDLQYEEFDRVQVNGYNVINSADFAKHYVFMDDNKLPFELREFDNFDYDYEKTIIKYFITPLYRRIFLEANDAEKIFYNVLENTSIGLTNLGDLTDDLVIRIFLTTARNYKSSRFESDDDIQVKKLYVNLPLPKFVWVCEISTLELYKQNRAIGEVVLDATASKSGKKFDELILVRYRKNIGYKTYKENIYQLVNRLKVSLSKSVDFGVFDKNLKRNKSDGRDSR